MNFVHYEFCEISKNTFFTEHLQTTASTMNSFVSPHDLMRGQRGSYAYMQTKTVKKRPKKHITQNSKIKTDH